MTARIGVVCAGGWSWHQRPKHETSFHKRQPRRQFSHLHTFLTKNYTPLPRHSQAELSRPSSDAGKLNPALRRAVQVLRSAGAQASAQANTDSKFASSAGAPNTTGLPYILKYALEFSLSSSYGWQGTQRCRRHCLAWWRFVWQRFHAHCLC